MVIKKPMNLDYEPIAFVLCPRCGDRMPAGGGGPGIALSRRDNRTLICSACGTEEAVLDFALGESQIPPIYGREIAFLQRLIS